MKRAFTIGCALFMGVLGLGIQGTVVVQAAQNTVVQGPTTEFDTLPRIISADKRRSRGHKQFTAINMNATQMTAYASFDPGSVGQVIDMPIEKEIAVLKPPKGVGGYYWLLARDEAPGRIVTASGITYFSNPGPPPRELLKTEKAELMIAPVKLPREHNQFRAGKTWEFMLLHRNQPLANTEVLFATSQGTEQTLQTNAKGLFSVTFPDDFPAPGSQHEGHAMHGRLSAQFALLAELTAADKQLVAAFNHSYSPNPFRQKNRLFAVGLLIVGMALTTPMLRRRQKGA